MKVKRAVVYGTGIMSLLSALTSHFEFILIFILSVVPVLVLYANRELADLHNDAESWSGFKVFAHPVILFGILAFTHQFWLTGGFFR